MKRKVLITGASGDTGRAAVKESLALGLNVRAMVHGQDERSSALEKLGVEVLLGDLLDIATIRAAIEGVDAAYFAFAVADLRLLRFWDYWPDSPGRGVHIFTS